MPIQAPQWTDYLTCPVCCREFGAPPRSPISLSCGHTLCKQCLRQLHRKPCPFDQTYIKVEPEELVVNTALLQLAGYPPPSQPYHPPCIQMLSTAERAGYDTVIQCMEYLAPFVKWSVNLNNNVSGLRLSRPMQRKLVTLFQCAITDEGRGRAARAARSLGERTVMELILQHQHPQQLSAHLWAAVRARGCQFLGPAMQEEVLKLVLLALEDGSAISRKVLVMFVVQRMEQQFPQASKTSIGHVVQLLYRASCFKVSKRELNSSLMQLKEEFRNYEALRREHDAQIVQIATEAGLRIAPDQWSALLYGDTGHKSHMQSVIDKLQTPQSFLQSVQDLFVALHRTGDPCHLLDMDVHFHRLANIETGPDAPSPRWEELAEIMVALKDVVTGLVRYMEKVVVVQNKTEAGASTPDEAPSVVSGNNAHAPRVNRYKTVLCRDFLRNNLCPRGERCNFAHYEDELVRARQMEANQRQQETVSLPLPINFYRNFPPPAVRPSLVSHACPQMNNVVPVPFPIGGIPPPLTPLTAINVPVSLPLPHPEPCPYGFHGPVEFQPPGLEEIHYCRRDAPIFVIRKSFEAIPVPPHIAIVPDVNMQPLTNSLAVEGQGLDPCVTCSTNACADFNCQLQPVANAPVAGPSTRGDDLPPQDLVASRSEELQEGATLTEEDQILEEELKALEERFDHEYEWSS